MSYINERIAIKLLCSVVMLEQDIENLRLQSSYPKG